MLEYSSLLFIIPAVYAWYKNNIGYGNAFLFLTLTSYNYHKSINSTSNDKIIFDNLYNNLFNTLFNNITTNWKFWIDQFAIFNVVSIGIYYYNLRCNYYSQISIFICFIGCIILYLINKKYLDNTIHLIIHILTLIAHNIIIFNY